MLASDFLFDECPDMSKKHASADCEYTEAGESSRVYDVSKITPLSIKNFFSNNYTYGIMSGVGKNTTTNIYIGVRINE